MTMAQNNVRAAVERKKRPKESWDDQLVFALMVGLVFGLVAEKSGAINVVRNQFVCQDFQIAKMYLSAAAGAQGIFALMCMISMFRFRVTETKQTTSSNAGFVALVAGSAMMGAGMAISASAPGLAWAQVGAGLNSGYFVILGGFIAAATYGFVKEPIDEVLEAPYYASRTAPQYLHDKLGMKYHEVAFIFCGFLVLCVQGLEVLYPKAVPPLDEDEEEANLVVRYLTYKNWTAAFGGAIFGVLQGPCVYMLERTYTHSTAFVTLIAAPYYLIPKKQFYYDNLAKKHLGYHLKYYKETWYYCQFFILFGIYLGSMISTSFADTYGDGNDEVNPLLALIGGLLMGYGSRIADGCPMGALGISGLAHLEMNAIYSTTAMFVGGILPSLILPSFTTAN